MGDRKRDVIEMLRELAELTALDEASPQSFRVRAYENAMRAVEALARDPGTMSVGELMKVDGIGKATAEKIRELCDTGRVPKLEGLREKHPASVVELTRIPGLGPKRVQRLRSELGVSNLDELRGALASHALRDLEGFGEKTEANLSRAIERLGMKSGARRTPIHEALPLALRLVAELGALPMVVRAEHCGSLRRMRETIGDVDLIAASTEPASVCGRFVELPLVTSVLAHGDTKSSVLVRGGMQVDLRVVAPEHYGAAVLYFTGSKAHNIKLRQRALERGWTLNEYALSELDGGRVIASREEAEIYAALGLPWIPPPLREDSGEVEAALEGRLPPAIAVTELCGDLHVHTTLSGDGRSSLDDVLATAAGRGYRYLAITDHAENLAINGVSREQLRGQWDELAQKRERHPDLHILRGAELNIGADGTLDYDPAFRRSLDWCVAAVHSHFDLPPAQQTARILRAMGDPAVNVIGHLSGRMIGSRPGIEIDVAAVLDAAVETGTAIEINASLARLDASVEVLRQARDRGVVWVISSDAHHIGDFGRMDWGVLHALRGWVDRDQVANLWPRERFLAWARKKRER